MKEGHFETGPSREEPRRTETFEEYFSGGEISDADLAELPDDVQEKLEQLGMRYLNVDSYEPGRFHDVQKVEIGPKDLIYIARKIKDYQSAGTEESTFLVDYRDGEIAGYGEIRYHLTKDSGYFKDKPFVGFTETEEKHRRGGLAERRLRVMNALARQKYGNPLYSDTAISPEARSLWKKLVDKGEAREFKEGEQDRYVFDDPGA